MTPARARILGRRWRIACLVAAVLWLTAWGLGFPYMGILPGGPLIFLVFANGHYGWADGYDYANKHREDTP